MRVFVGGIITETNTFSPVPTGFDDYVIARPDASANALESQIFAHLQNLIEQKELTFCPSFIAIAEPGGITTRSTYERLREMLLEDLKKLLPVDLVILPLHGAMVADGYDDCEGDIVSRVRSIVGPSIPVGVELDLHCHLTQTMVAQSDLITIYREYPHTDILQRAEALLNMTVDMARGKTRPVMEMYDCRMINLYPTALEPMRSIVNKLSEIEQRENIISVDIGHGFPWGDVPDCGTRTLVISDNDSALAQQAAKEIGELIFEHRHELLFNPISLKKAIQILQQKEHTGSPIVIADVADNAGGGAASDSTTVLDAMLSSGVTDCAIGMIWDPQVVSIARKAGAGANVTVRLGGKMSVDSGQPLDLNVKVVGVINDLVQPFPQDSGDALPVPCGDAVCLECGGVFIIVNSIRTQVFHPDIFTSFDIDLSRIKGLVVKSIFHFYAGFAPVASGVLLMGAPGPLNPDFTKVPYKKAGLHKFPWKNDPFR